MRLHSPLLSELPGLAHAFSTREGGVSPEPQDSLSLALRGAGTPDQVRENWARFLAPHPVDGLAICDQVHGDGVVVVDRGQGPLRTVAQGDALVTTTPGVWLAVRTADCVPILLAAPGRCRRGTCRMAWHGRSHRRTGCRELVCPDGVLAF